MQLKNKIFSVFCSEGMGGVRVVSVSMRTDSGVKGCAEANFLPDKKYWWICRVVINPDGARGQGLGSKMLRLLIDNIFDTDNHRIVVAPGGYYADPEKQINFYKKHGFEKDHVEEFLVLTKEKWHKLQGRA